MGRLRAGGTGHVELVDGDVALSGDGLGADLVEQADDGLVAEHDLAPKAADAALARGVAEIGEQQPADAARLPVVHDGDRRLGRVTSGRETDAAPMGSVLPSPALRHAERATWSMPSVCSKRSCTLFGIRGMGVKNRKQRDFGDRLSKPARNAPRSSGRSIRTVTSVASASRWTRFHARSMQNPFEPRRSSAIGAVPCFAYVVVVHRTMATGASRALGRSTVVAE